MANGIGAHAGALGELADSEERPHDDNERVLFGLTQAQVAELLRVDICGNFRRGPAVAGERIAFRKLRYRPLPRRVKSRCVVRANNPGAHANAHAKNCRA